MIGGDYFFHEESVSLWIGNACEVVDVAPVQLMETYRGCVGRAALIISHDFI